MADVSIEISFDIVCQHCGAILDAEYRGKGFLVKDELTVYPCEKCLNDKYDEGFEQGQLDTH